MKKLTIEDRRKLFKGYMENSWVNPAHMYLAELYDEYVDFILTTNFDDLILQSLAIRNVFPPTYDMPLIHKEDLGTTEFEIGSVFYLHGQRYGLHHLHTQEEMLRVKDVVESVLRSIVAGRPWIVVGYSGKDPIFECMCNLGSFNSGLYWIAHEEGSFNDHTAPFYKKGKLGGLRKLIYKKGADLFMHDLYKEVKRGRESGISFSPYQTKWEDKIKFLENMASLYSEDNEYLKLSFEDRARFEKAHGVNFL